MLGFNSCKSAKLVNSDGTIDNALSTKQVIKEHKRQNLDFKTLQGKVKIEYSQSGKNKTQSYTLTIRMEKDKTIWLNATLGLARAKITPEKVQFYDKINNQFFDGDYRLLSDLLGVELDFSQVQNLLLGQSIFALSDKTYEAEVYEATYKLNPKEQNAIFEIFLLLNPAHYKSQSIQIFQPKERRFLQVDYLSYQNLEKQIVPKQIKMVAVEADDEVGIKLELKSIALNKDLRFPFKIPSGYKEIKL